MNGEGDFGMGDEVDMGTEQLFGAELHSYILVRCIETGPVQYRNIIWIHLLHRRLIFYIFNDAVVLTSIQQLFSHSLYS
jgi:hypothetical protein